MTLSPNVLPPATVDGGWVVMSNCEVAAAVTVIALEVPETELLAVMVWLPAFVIMALIVVVPLASVTVPSGPLKLEDSVTGVVLEKPVSTLL